MAVKYIGLVWEHSQHSGAKLLLMLAYADWADHDGYAWPKMKNLARKARISVRQAQRYKSALVKSGELTIVEAGRGKNRPDKVQITISKGDRSDGFKGDRSDGLKVTDMSPPIYEPSIEPSGLTVNRTVIGDSGSSSSSDLYSDLEPQNEKPNDDDDDLDFIFRKLRDEFKIAKTEATVMTVLGWFNEHPVSHIDAAITRAATYTPSAPLRYISSVLEGEVGRQRSVHRNDGYEIPKDMKDIIIG